MERWFPNHDYSVLLHISHRPSPEGNRKSIWLVGIERRMRYSDFFACLHQHMFKSHCPEHRRQRHRPGEQRTACCWTKVIFETIQVTWVFAGLWDLMRRTQGSWGNWQMKLVSHSSFCLRSCGSPGKLPMTGKEKNVTLAFRNVKKEVLGSYLPVSNKITES